MTDTASAPARLGIDVWLDIACPWCALGERRLGAVLDALPFGDDVDVRFHSFQPRPAADPHPGLDDQWIRPPARERKGDME